MKPTRPIMRYHGGKWRLATWILSHLPPHDCYVEPYGGAASILMRKPRVRAEVYNDLDGALVNVFRVLQNPQTAVRLRELVELTPYSRAEFDRAYEPTDDPIEWARRVLILAWMGFGGSGTRRHRTGIRPMVGRRGNHPADNWASWPLQIPAFTARLSRVMLECKDALQLIARYDHEDTLHYVDPPYLKSTRTSLQNGHKQHYRHDMTDEQHRLLATVLHGVKGMVVLSGYPCALYDEELYPDWKRYTHHATADGGAARSEVLWLNPAAVAAARHPALSLEAAHG